MSLLSFLARRFVAGETVQEAVAAAQRMNQRGVRVILDFLGEHVDSPEEARAAVAEYLRLLDAIHNAQVGASISLKASQMGLLISPDLCLENLLTVSKRAAQLNNIVWIDMEGSALTQKTIDVFERLRAQTPNIGLCLQAYLVRTGGDLDRLLRQPLRVRLCKGAYKEPPEIAYSTRRAVDGNYRMLVQKLLDNTSRDVYPAFATHDRGLIQEILERVRANGIDLKRFEFEMLYGIENAYLESLAHQGYQTQVYIPYGTHWFPYFLRRLRERKENVYFLIRNIFKV
jgi:proline dehydrogenase